MARRKLPHPQINTLEINNKTKLKDFLALCVSIVILSLAATLTKQSQTELNANAITFNRFWIATLALVFWQILQRIMQKKSLKFSISKSNYITIKDLLLLVGAGCSFSGSLITWTWSFDMTSVAHSSLLHYQNPIFTTLVAWLIFGHSFDRKFLLGLALALGGGCILVFDDLGTNQVTFVGNLVALLSGVLFSIEILIVEQLRNKLSSVTINTGISLISAIVCFPFALLTEDRLFPHSWTVWLSVIFLGVMCQFVGYALFFYSLKRFSSGFATIALMFDIVISAILAWIFFSESLSPLDCLAFPMVFVGIYLAKQGKGAEKI